MPDYIEEDYNKPEYDEIFYDWYEIKGLVKIKELSRQLRTFFNFKTEIIRLRFRTSLNSWGDGLSIQFYRQKQEIESLTNDFINILKKIKEINVPLEEAIHSLFFKRNKKRLNYLLELTGKLSKLLHLFSEKNTHLHPNFLKFTVVLVKNISFIKKCLHPKFGEFYEELEINYSSLEKELEHLLENAPSLKINKSKKQYGERLPS